MLDDLKHVGGDLGEIEVALILVDKLLKVFFYFTLERELLCCAVLCCAVLCCAALFRFSFLICHRLNIKVLNELPAEV